MSDWFSENDYKQALIGLGKTVTAIQHRMLSAHAEAPDCMLSVRQLAAAAGYDNSNATYSQYGRLGHLIAQSLGVRVPWKVWTHFIGANERTDDGELIWTMHPELAAALVSLGWASRATNSEDDRVAGKSDDGETSTSATDREVLALARIGQGPFRNALHKSWGSCAVTGVSQLAVLRASHIKPWKSANNQERIDPNNGLFLAAHIDALFDRGLITFGADRKIRLSPFIAKEDLQLLGISDATCLRRMSAENEKYMQFHRDFVFQTGEIRK